MPELSKTSQIALALAMPAGAIAAYWLYLKWSSDDDFYETNKVATSHNIRIKVLVPKKAVGTVIGKQGATIKMIQAETGARMNFNDRSLEEDGKPRVLMISGTPEKAQKAELIVYQIISEMPEALTEQIQVPYYCIGRIIGKGGIIIRDLRRASGVRIDIDKEQGRDDNGMRAVALTGSRQQIDLAIELIEEIVKKAEEEKHEAESGKQTTSATTTTTTTTTTAGSFRDGSKVSPFQSFKNVSFVPREKGSIKASAIPVEEADEWDTSLDEDVISVGTVNSMAEKDNSPMGDNFIQVMVSAVEHPGHFWVQHVGAESLHLEQMQKDMTHQLDFEDIRQNLSVSDAQPGDLVAAKFEEEDPVYYRAKVLAVTEEGKVDLYFLDYGDNVFADMDKIYKLRSEFQAFPHQAIQCELANVEPVDDGAKWSEEAVTLFEDLVYCAQWKPLYAKVVTHARIDADLQQGQGEGDGLKTELRPCLQLIDTSGGQDVDIAEKLVGQGHAKKASKTDSTSLS